MQNEARTVSILGLNLAVEIDFIPVVDASGLSLNQVAPHWEASLWKIERVFEVLCHVSAPILGPALCKNRADAKKLVEGLESSAVARGLLTAGAGKMALEQAPDGLLKTFLENR